MTEIRNSLRGLRRTLQRRQITDASDMTPDEAAAVSVAIALEHARDQARLGALIAEGADRVMAARRRAALCQALLDAVLGDLGEGGARHVTALDLRWRVAEAEATRAFDRLALKHTAEKEDQ